MPHEDELEQALTCGQQEWAGVIDFRTAAQPFLDFLQSHSTADEACSTAAVARVLDALCYAMASPNPRWMEDLNAAASAAIEDRDMEWHQRFHLREAGDERNSALRDIRDFMIDEMLQAAERESHSAQNASRDFDHKRVDAEMAWWMSTALSMWTGTKADELDDRARASLIEKEFAFVRDQGLDDSDLQEIVRVKIGRALKKLGAAPAVTSALRMHKQRAGEELWGLLKDAGSHDPATIAAQFLTARFCGCLRVQNVDAARDLIAAALPEPPLRSFRKAAEAAVEVLWTRDTLAMPDATRFPEE